MLTFSNKLKTQKVLETRFVVSRLIAQMVKRAHARVVQAWVTCWEVFGHVFLSHD